MSLVNTSQYDYVLESDTISSAVARFSYLLIVSGEWFP